MVRLPQFEGESEANTAPWISGANEWPVNEPLLPLEGEGKMDGTLG
jgi:hypothetical protein